MTEAISLFIYVLFLYYCLARARSSRQRSGLYSDSWYCPARFQVELFVCCSGHHPSLAAYSISPDCRCASLSFRWTFGICALAPPGDQHPVNAGVA